MEEQEKGNISLIPFHPDQINPNSYNYRLGRYLKEKTNDSPLEFKEIDLLDYPDGYVLNSNKFYLGSTYEMIGSNKYAMSLIGRSSMGRYGLFLQVSANLGHTNSKHCWTLEILPLINLKVYFKMKIGQVSFWENHGDIKGTNHLYNRYNLPTESKVLIR